jgi:hypothetical protein
MAAAAAAAAVDSSAHLAGYWPQAAAAVGGGGGGGGGGVVCDTSMHGVTMGIHTALADTQYSITSTDTSCYQCCAVSDSPTSWRHWRVFLPEMKQCSQVIMIHTQRLHCMKCKK